MEEQFLTVEQVSKILQLHPFTVLRYIKQGRLMGAKLGRGYRLKKSDVNDFLEKQGFRKTIKETKKEDVHKLETEVMKETELFKLKEGKGYGTGNEDHYIIE